MQKYDIVLVDLNPVMWSEQSGIRPCIIIQNNRANQFSTTFVIAIISSIIKDYPHMLIVNPSKINWLLQKSRIDFLQVRTIDKRRIVKTLWTLDEKYKSDLNDKIRIAFEL